MVCVLVLVPVPTCVMSFLARAQNPARTCCIRQACVARRLNEELRGFESEAPCCSKENLLGSRVCCRIVNCELQSDGHGREHCAGALDGGINLTYFVSIAPALASSMNSSCFSERLQSRSGVCRRHCSACLSLFPFPHVLFHFSLVLIIHRGHVAFVNDAFRTA